MPKDRIQKLAKDQNEVESLYLYRDAVSFVQIKELSKRNVNLKLLIQMMIKFGEKTKWGDLTEVLQEVYLNL